MSEQEKHPRDELLRDLYNGRLYPAEQCRCGNVDYEELSQTVDGLMAALQAQLDPAGAEALETLHTTLLRTAALECEEMVVVGVKMGVKLAVEGLAIGNK